MLGVTMGWPSLGQVEASRDPRRSVAKCAAKGPRRIRVSSFSWSFCLVLCPGPFFDVPFTDTRRLPMPPLTAPTLTETLGGMRAEPKGVDRW